MRHLKELATDLLVYLAIASVFTLATAVLWFASLFFQ